MQVAHKVKEAGYANLNMKTSIFQSLKPAALAMLLITTAGAVRGQGFLLSVKPSTPSVLAGNPVTYTINLTNQSGFTLADLLSPIRFLLP